MNFMIFGTGPYFGHVPPLQVTSIFEHCALAQRSGPSKPWFDSHSGLKSMNFMIVDAGSYFEKIPVCRQTLFVANLFVGRQGVCSSETLFVRNSMRQKLYSSEALFVRSSVRGWRRKPIDGRAAAAIIVSRGGLPQKSDHMHGWLHLPPRCLTEHLNYQIR